MGRKPRGVGGAADDDGMDYVKCRVTAELKQHIVLVGSRRRAEGESPNTIQDMVGQAIQDYFDPDGAKKNEIEELEGRVLLVAEAARQAAVNLRHFGHRDAATQVLVLLKEAEVEVSIEGIEGEGGKETKRS